MFLRNIKERCSWNFERLLRLKMGLKYDKRLLYSLGFLSKGVTKSDLRHVDFQQKSSWHAYYVQYGGRNTRTRNTIVQQHFISFPGGTFPLAQTGSSLLLSPLRSRPCTEWISHYVHVSQLKNLFKKIKNLIAKVINKWNSKLSSMNLVL